MTDAEEYSIGERVYVTIPIDPAIPMTGEEIGLMEGAFLEITLRKREGDLFTLPLVAGVVHSATVEDVIDSHVWQVAKIVMLPEEEAVALEVPVEIRNRREG